MTPKARPVAPSKNKKKKADLVTTKNYRIRAAKKQELKENLGTTHEQEHVVVLIRKAPVRSLC